MGGAAHGALSQNRGRTHRQRRALREMPRRSQLRRRGGHRQPGKLRGGGEIVLKTSNHQNQLRQLHHLYRRKDDQHGNLAVGQCLTWAGGGSVVLTSIVMLMLVVGARTAIHNCDAPIHPITARRSRDHQGQQQKCEDLVETFHSGSGGKTRRHCEMVKVGMLFQQREGKIPHSAEAL